MCVSNTIMKYLQTSIIFTFIAYAALFLSTLIVLGDVQPPKEFIRISFLLSSDDRQTDRRKKLLSFSCRQTCHKVSVGAVLKMQNVAGRNRWQR